MAAARLTPTGTRLQAVRDEDVVDIAESAWERMLRLDVVTPPSPRLADISGAIVQAERDRKACKTGARYWRPLIKPRVAEIGDAKITVEFEQKREMLKVSPREVTFAFDRPRSLARVKGYSLGTGKLTIKEKEESKRLRPYMLRQVPKTRADCVDGPRPCNVARCRHSLLITVNPENGSIKLNFPDKLPEELEYTCSLDAADSETGMTLERVGELNGLSLARVLQIETSGLAKLKASLNPEAVRALLSGGRTTEDNED